MDVISPASFSRHNREFCDYGDCRAYALGGVRLNVCQEHARVMYEDALTLDLFPHVEAETRAYATGRGTVYALLFGNRIKIGFSRNLPQRLQNVPHDEVLAQRDGLTVEDERNLHAAVAEHRITGEWFADVPEVRDIVELIKVM